MAPTRLARALWLLGGAALMLLAWLAGGRAHGLENLMFPAGAWMLLRGLT